MEQQLPSAKLPQTVPPYAAPQVPSVVTGADADAVALLVVDVDDDATKTDELLEALVHPDWQPTPQWAEL
jgi:hypothetical protein